MSAQLQNAVVNFCMDPTLHGDFDLYFQNRDITSFFVKARETYGFTCFNCGGKRFAAHETFVRKCHNCDYYQSLTAGTTLDNRRLDPRSLLQGCWSLAHDHAFITGPAMQKAFCLAHRHSARRFAQALQTQMWPMRHQRLVDPHLVQILPLMDIVRTQTPVVGVLFVAGGRRAYMAPLADLRGETVSRALSEFVDPATINARRLSQQVGLCEDSMSYASEVLRLIASQFTRPISLETLRDCLTEYAWRHHLSDRSDVVMEEKPHAVAVFEELVILALRPIRSIPEPPKSLRSAYLRPYLKQVLGIKRSSLPPDEESPVVEAQRRVLGDLEELCREQLAGLASGFRN